MYGLFGNYLIAFKDNRIVADRKEISESESLLLKLGSVDRLSVFKKFGTEVQMLKYLNHLSKLIGIKLELIEHRKIKIQNTINEISEAQRIIASKLKKEAP